MTDGETAREFRGTLRYEHASEYVGALRLAARYAKAGCAAAVCTRCTTQCTVHDLICYTSWLTACRPTRYKSG